MKTLKPLQSTQAKGLIWAAGVIANDWEAAEFVWQLKQDDEVGYNCLINEIRTNGEFYPETTLLLAIFYPEIWERMERVAQAIWVMSVCETDKAYLN